MSESGLLTDAKANWPTTTWLTSEDCAVIAPPLAIETDVTCEAGTPSCVLAETADVAANWVINGVPVPLLVARFPFMARSLAPSDKPVIARGVGAGAVGEVKVP